MSITNNPASKHHISIIKNSGLSCGYCALGNVKFNNRLAFARMIYNCRLFGTIISYLNIATHRNSLRFSVRKQINAANGKFL